MLLGNVRAVGTVVVGLADNHGGMENHQDTSCSRNPFFGCDNVLLPSLVGRKVLLLHFSIARWGENRLLGELYINMLHNRQGTQVNVTVRVDMIYR